MVYKELGSQAICGFNNKNQCLELILETNGQPKKITEDCNESSDLPVSVNNLMGALLYQLVFKCFYKASNLSVISGGGGFMTIVEV